MKNMPLKVKAERWQQSESNFDGLLFLPSFASGINLAPSITVKKVILSQELNGSQNLL